MASSRLLDAWQILDPLMYPIVFTKTVLIPELWNYMLDWHSLIGLRSMLKGTLQAHISSFTPSPFGPALAEVMQILKTYKIELSVPNYQIITLVGSSFRTALFLPKVYRT